MIKKEIDFIKRNLKCILILNIIIVLFVCNKNVLAKNLKNINIIGIGKIATSILEIDEGEVSTIDNINKLSAYKFCIRNYNDKNISDTSQIYTIEIIGKNLSNFKFDLYEEFIDKSTNEVIEEKIDLINNKTKEIEIKARNKEEKKYKLTIQYYETTNQDINEEIKIKINSEQEKVL